MELLHTIILTIHIIAGLSLPTVIIQEGGYDVERLGLYVARLLTGLIRHT